MDDLDADGDGVVGRVSRVERRASTRKRHVSTKVAVVDKLTRQQAAAARLEALENDNATVVEAVDVDEDDEAFDFEEEIEEVFGESSKRRKGGGRASGGKRKLTRNQKAAERLAVAKKAPRAFGEILQEAELESYPPHVPTYLTAAVGPSAVASRRHFCSVCGFTAPYTCTRCGARFCSLKCQTIHTDTRCLKFVA